MTMLFRLFNKIKFFYKMDFLSFSNFEKSCIMLVCMSIPFSFCHSITLFSLLVQSTWRAIEAVFMVTASVSASWLPLSFLFVEGDN